MNLKALRILVTVALFSLTVTIFAADEKKEDKPEFPGKPGLEFKQTLHTGAAGNKIAKTEGAESSVYSKTEFKGQLAFSFLDKLYTITPWAKERLDLYFEPVKDVTKVNDVTTDALTASINARNRFEFGFTNDINLKDIIKISVNPAFRVENNLTRNAKDIDGNAFYPAVKFVFMPSLNLGYSYKMGFSWSLANTVYLHMYPVMDLAKVKGTSDLNNGESILGQIDYEGIYDIAFNILKPLDIKDYSFSIFVQEYIYTELYGTKYIKDIDYNKNPKAGLNQGTYDFETKVGVKGDFFGVNLFANSYTKIKGTIDNIDANGSNVWTGLQAGASVKVDKFSFGVTYTGMQQVWLGEVKNDSGIFEPRATKDTDLKYWNNVIEGYFSIKL